MTEEFEKPMRLNTRVSANVNRWLDKKSYEMAISKSALVAVAVENYMKEVEVVNGLPKMLQQLEELEKKGIKLNDLNLPVE